jgi:membrane protein
VKKSGKSDGEGGIAAKGLSGRIEPVKGWATTRFSRYRDTPAGGIVAEVMLRDKESAGGVAGSAIAFRLFLFFVPLLLFVVGIAGFVSGFVSAHDVEVAIGVSGGGLAAQIRAAFAEPGATRWVATALGLLGMLTAGRSLSKVLISSAAIAWKVPTPKRTSMRTLGTVAGLVCVMGLVSIIVNRLREDFGVGVAGPSLIPAFVVYLAAWLGLSIFLPRGTNDPGALLPGSVIVAFSITAMQGLSELYLPDKLSRASELYGAIGTTVVTLGWFFFLGRSIALSTEINAVMFERLGSVSSRVFSLPLFRALPRRSARVRAFFDLEPEP